jgi:HEAT repeat protein
MIDKSKNRMFGVLVAVALLAGVALAQSSTDKAWGILNAAASDSNTGKRAGAMAVLGLVKHDAKAQALAEKGLSDEKAEVRAAAADSLGDMGANGAIPNLKKAVRDTDVSVVLAAAHSLYMLKQPSACEVYYAVLTGEKKGGQGLMAEQKKMLNDPKKMAQFGFETGVGFIPFGGLGLGALKAVTKDDVSPVRAAAAKILANDPDPKTGEALVAAASEKSWIVRAAALDAIARRGERALAAKIEPLMDDDKDIVKYLAAAAVIQLNAEPPALRRK